MHRALVRSEPHHGHSLAEDLTFLSRLERRRALAWMAAISGGPLLSACGGGGGSSSTTTTATAATAAMKRGVPHITVRTSLIARHRSMRSFERLSSRILVVVSTTMAIAMTAFICVTAHLLG